MQGNNAKDLRAYLGLSLKDVAKLANVSRKTVELFERELPIMLDDKRKITAVLYLEKASRFA